MANSGCVIQRSLTFFVLYIHLCTSFNQYINYLFMAAIGRHMKWSINVFVPCVYFHTLINQQLNYVFFAVPGP